MATINGTPDQDYIEGTGGNDVILGGDGDDTVFGFGGDDRLYGGAGDDQIDGGARDDLIVGGAGRDTMIGGAGNDTFGMSSLSDFVAGESYIGGAGTDFIRFTSDLGSLVADFSDVILDGIEGIEIGSGEARLTAAQFDALTAVDGTFTLTTAGAVSLAGVVSASSSPFSSGFPRLSLNLSGAGNVVDMRGFIAQFASVRGDAAADIVLGGVGNDDILGRDGDDSLSGGAGSDQLQGGFGRDVIEGGDGDDTIRVDIRGELVTGDVIDGGNGFDTLLIAVSEPTSLDDVNLARADIRNIEAISVFNALLFVESSQLANFQIFGGFSFIDSGTVNLSGTSSTQFLAFTLSPGGNTIDLNQIDVAGGPVYVTGQEGNDFITGLMNSGNSLLGGAGDDIITGGSAGDYLQGEANNDTLIGGAGADTMFGGTGDDLFLVDDDEDSVIEFPDGGQDTVLASISYALAFGQAVEVLSATNGTLEADSARPINLTGNELGQFINGNDRENVLSGAGGNDWLRGYLANDVLIGGAGIDTLEGGAGIDTFAGTLADMAGDTLVDFALGERILLTDAVLDGFRFQRSGNTLTLPGGATGVSVFLPSEGNPMLITRAAREGRVELIAVGHEAHANDFNADGHGDLLWRHTPSGAFSTWDGQGNALANGFVENSYFSAAQPVTTQGVASLDWNGDGRSDMLWRDAAGTFGVWAGGPDGFVRDATTIAGIGRDWSVTAVGDFSGDGRDDLMFRNVNGALTVWQSAGAGFTPNVFVSFADPSWVVAGVMDFDGDGRDDIVWRNQGAGLFTIWGASGDAGATAFTPNIYADAGVDGSWSIAALADFNGDGKDDLLWRNAGGIFTEWQSTGSGFRTNVYADASVSTAWSVAQAADMNGDGMADIVWRNADVGHVSVWQSTGDGFIANTAYVASVSTDWALIGATGMVPIV